MIKKLVLSTILLFLVAVIAILLFLPAIIDKQMNAVSEHEEFIVCLLYTSDAADD